MKGTGHDGQYVFTSQVSNTLPPGGPLAMVALLLDWSPWQRPATASASSTGRRSINVPRDFPTIQAAVDAAAPGATIHVGPGTYTEQIPITKDLDLRGVGAAATVIQTLATLVPFGVFLPTGRRWLQWCGRERRTCASRAWR